MKRVGHPILRPFGSVNSIEPGLTVRWKDDSVDPTIMYVGEAEIGSDDNSPVWRIQKVNTTTEEITFAGAGEFNQVWNNRESLGYV